MTVEIQQYLTDVMPLVLRAAMSWSLLGLLAGWVLGALLYGALGLLGAWRIPGPPRRWLRLASIAWFVGATGLSGSLVLGAIGAYQGLYRAAREAPSADEVLGAIGDVAVEVSMSFGVTVGEAGLIHPGEGSPITPEVAAAVRDGSGEVPVADVRAAILGYGRALQADGPEVMKQLADKVEAASPKSVRGLVRHGLVRVSDVVRAGGDVRALDPALGTAWAGLDEVAAATGRADALSRDEIATLVVDRMALPMLLRPSVVLIAPWAFVGLLILPFAWGVPGLVVWMVRRRATGKDDGPVEGLDAIR